MKPEELSALADTLTAIATTAGILIAAIGLTTWRKQLRGTTEYELAKRLLLQVYRLRDALQYTRSPFLNVGEAGEVPEGMSWEIAAYNHRWDTVREATSKLSAVALECEVVWGSDIDNLTQELRSHIFTLSNAVDAFVRAKEDPSFRDDFTREMRDILYSRGSSDPYEIKLKEKILAFEEYVKPHLRRGQQTRTTLNRLLEFLKKGIGL